MTLVALRHTSLYRYDRPVALGPQLVRLRPAPHCRTATNDYALTIDPADHSLHWLQDPVGNHLARLLFPAKTERLSLTVDLTARLMPLNPFDFFVEPAAATFPFVYEAWLRRQLRPFLEAEPAGPRLTEWLGDTALQPIDTVGLLVNLNRRLAGNIAYLTRDEPGVQGCEETLTAGRGSCRDTGWLLLQILRQLGIAARFTSGYLLQLKPDQVPVDGPPGPKADRADLHAWAEAYIPGAGWIGLDPTSGLLAGEGHIPLASAPDPASAAPLVGTVEPSAVRFEAGLTLTRLGNPVDLAPAGQESIVSDPFVSVRQTENKSRSQLSST